MIFLPVISGSQIQNFKDNILKRTWNPFPSRQAMKGLWWEDLLMGWESNFSILQRLKWRLSVTCTLNISPLIPRIVLLLFIVWKDQTSSGEKQTKQKFIFFPSFFRRQNSCFSFPKIQLITKLGLALGQVILRLFVNVSCHYQMGKSEHEDDHCWKT